MVIEATPHLNYLSALDLRDLSRHNLFLRQEMTMPKRNKSDIDVTPEMIRAGLDAWAGWDERVEDIEEALPRIFRAMASVEPKRVPVE